MKVDGIEYGLETPWQIEVPDSAIVIEGTDQNRIPPPLEDASQAVRDAIRNPLGTRPLSDQVGSASTVTIAVNDWMGFPIAVEVILDELREAGVDERNVRIVVAGGLTPEERRRQLAYVAGAGSRDWRGPAARLRDRRRPVCEAPGSPETPRSRRLYLNPAASLGASVTYIRPDSQTSDQAR
jgi:Lactate racemase N-terminal domain